MSVLRFIRSSRDWTNFTQTAVLYKKITMVSFIFWLTSNRCNCWRQLVFRKDWDLCMIWLQHGALTHWVRAPWIAEFNSGHWRQIAYNLDWRLTSNQWSQPLGAKGEHWRQNFKLFDTKWRHNFRCNSTLSECFCMRFFPFERWDYAPHFPVNRSVWPDLKDGSKTCPKFVFIFHFLALVSRFSP